jgi:hypothetical protein
MKFIVSQAEAGDLSNQIQKALAQAKQLEAE